MTCKGQTFAAQHGRCLLPVGLRFLHTPLIFNIMAEKTRYSDEELVEFRDLILEKIKLAQRDYQQMMDVLTNKEGNGVDDTMPTYKILEEGSMTQTREELTNMAARQQKFIQGLQAALIRIENKTYGVCRVTGKLIPKERLRAVPHATMSIEAKLASKKR